ncbi:MAG: Arc family DNA binding domain-containing protein [Phycisphaerae bacterium]|nr:Arc family DNA binding domain-containing protein [Phycisphaerae bacterium]
MEPRKQFLLRIDPELWTELERWAAEELRSVNGQIEYLLRQAVVKRKGGEKKLSDENKPTS